MVPIRYLFGRVLRTLREPSGNRGAPERQRSFASVRGKPTEEQGDWLFLVTNRGFLVPLVHLHHHQ